jgi:putative NADH-flavin reductase
MKLVVFGSTGRTGRLVVEAALIQGHDVTAVARRPEALALAHPKLTAVAGDVLDAGATAAAIAGHDAVVSAIAPQLRGPAVYAVGAQHFIAGMRAAGITRLICTSAAAIEPEASVPFPLMLLSRFVVRPLLRGPFDDALRMEAVLASSDLDWTVVRAPRLTNGRGRGLYRTAVRAHLHHALSISRADLADCILKLVPDASSYGAWVEVAD